MKSIIVIISIKTCIPTSNKNDLRAAAISPSLYKDCAIANQLQYLQYVCKRSFWFDKIQFYLLCLFRNNRGCVSVLDAKHIILNLKTMISHTQKNNRDR